MGACTCRNCGAFSQELICTKCKLVDALNMIQELCSEAERVLVISNDRIDVFEADNSTYVLQGAKSESVARELTRHAN